MTLPPCDLHVPDGLDAGAAVARTTHLGIGAHADDLEFMALDGILAARDSPDHWFGGITVTHGAGSARTGPFWGYSDQAMQAVRAQEQKAAADLGTYGFVAQLGLPSSQVKQPRTREDLVDTLDGFLRAARPETVYTHNPFDKHATHVGVLLAVIEACRRLPAEERPGRLLGCEVWRDLDWLPDHLKVVQDLSGHPDFARRLNAVFASQIAGGKRYDEAVEGRRRAHATFLESHGTDAMTHAAYAIDLTSLIRGTSPEALIPFTDRILDAFRNQVRGQLDSLLP
ncbi:MAG: PIG-L deacetylase family protein [Opitutales bacterium]